MISEGTPDEERDARSRPPHVQSEADRHALRVRRTHSAQQDCRVGQGTSSFKFKISTQGNETSGLSLRRLQSEAHRGQVLLRHLRILR